MKSLLPVFVAAPLLALAACNSKPSQPEVVDTNPDPMANILANRAPVELPPFGHVTVQVSAAESIGGYWSGLNCTFTFKLPGSDNAPGMKVILPKTVGAVVPE